MQVHSVLESLQQGILICDQHSRIVFFNQVYSDFIGVPLETAKGHKITDYRKSAIAPEVIWSGIPVEGMVRREGTQEYFASVYPIWEEPVSYTHLDVYKRQSNSFTTRQMP